MIVKKINNTVFYVHIQCNIERNYPLLRHTVKLTIVIKLLKKYSNAYLKKLQKGIYFDIV